MNISQFTLILEKLKQFDSKMPVRIEYEPGTDLPVRRIVVLIQEDRRSVLIEMGDSDK